MFVFVFVSHLVADDGELAGLEGVNDHLGVPAQLAALPERVLKHSRVGRHLTKMVVSTSAATYLNKVIAGLVSSYKIASLTRHMGSLLQSELNQLV